MSKPLISIITTVFNSERHITDCLTSVYEQEFIDYEHIIVNDGSTDNTIDLIKNFILITKCNKIHVFNFDKIGRAKALNIGIQNARSEVICILDSDDIWHPSKLKIQHTFFINNNVDLLSTNTILFHEISDIKHKHINNSNLLLDINSNKIYYKKLLIRNTISHSSVMIKKNICIYNENLTSQIDYELWLRILHQNIFLKFYSINLPLCYHRIHHHQYFESKGLRYKFKSIKLTNEFALKNNFYHIFFINLLKIPYYIISRYLIMLYSKFK
jgi:teichuronic acid biosynthesis glycosyltransferase TuaG